MQPLDQLASPLQQHLHRPDTLVLVDLLHDEGEEGVAVHWNHFVHETLQFGVFHVDFVGVL